MLQHVVKAEVVNRVFCSVDLVVAVLEVRLNDESRRVSSLRCTRVVGASIAALGQDVWDVAVFCDDFLDELGKAWVDVVRDDADRFWLASIDRLLNVAGHVLLEHSLYVVTGLLV
jgi:hypothetical protein